MMKLNACFKHTLQRIQRLSWSKKNLVAVTKNFLRSFFYLILPAVSDSACKLLLFQLLLITGQSEAAYWEDEDELGKMI